MPAWFSIHEPCKYLMQIILKGKSLWALQARKTICTNVWMKLKKVTYVHYFYGSFFVSLYFFYSKLFIKLNIKEKGNLYRQTWKYSLIYSIKYLEKEKKITIVYKSFHVFYLIDFWICDLAFKLKLTPFFAFLGSTTLLAFELSKMHQWTTFCYIWTVFSLLYFRKKEKGR